MKKYLFERHYDVKAKEFYELKMGSMINEEYMTKFMELLRYVPCLKDEKTKVQRFIIRFPLAFKDQIEYDEPHPLQEGIKKLKHCYNQSKRKSEPNWDWNRNDKSKGKWRQKQEIPQDAGEKENFSSYKTFSATEKGHRSQPREQQNKSSAKNHCSVGFVENTII